MMTLWHSTLALVMLSVFVTGVGMGFAMVSLINVVAMASPRAEFGVASGMNTLFRVVGGSIGPVLAGVITTSFLVSYTPPGSPISIEIPGLEGYLLVFILGGVLAFIGALVCIIMRPGHGLSYDEEHILTSEGEA